MANSGTISTEFCNGLCTVSAEWSTEPNLLTGNSKLTVKVYLDTSNAYKISNIPAYSNKSYIKFLNTEYYFSTPAVTSKGKTLMGTVTIDNAPSGNYYLSFDLYVNKMKAYSSLMSYVTSASSVGDYSTINIDTVDRLATSGVSGNHTLNVDNTLTVTPKHANFTHTVKYKCGSLSGTLLNNVKTTSLTFKLPLNLATQNTTGTTLTVVFTTTTYYNGTSIGSTTITKTYTIPTSVAPSCSIVITDDENLTSKYGGYVQNQSRFKIVTTPTLAYNSPISAYKITANGETLTGATSVTALLKNSGSQTVKATVTDKRGRSGSAQLSVNVIPYSPPVVSKLTVKRCNEDGTENYKGEYIQITFNATISPVNNVNSAKYQLRYQTTSGLDQNDIIISKYTGVYSVTNGTYIFKADPQNSYTIEVRAIDDFTSGYKTTGGSSAMTILNLLASGLGIAFGTVATLENVLESAFTLFPSGGFKFPKLSSDAVIHNITTSNIYLIENAEDLDHIPSEFSGSGILIVLPFGSEGDFLHVIISSTPQIYFRVLVDSSLGTWRKISTTTVS